MLAPNATWKAFSTSNNLARTLLAVITLLSLFFMAGSPAAEAANSALTDKFKPGSYRPGEVLVKFKDSSGGRRVNNQGLAPENITNSASLQRFGLKSYKALNLLPGVFKYTADNGADMAQMVAALSLQPDVELAEPNYIYRITASPNDTLFKETDLNPAAGLATRQWYAPRIGLESLWDVTKGNNQVIAVLDTGINPYHEDLAGRVILDRAYDFIQGRPAGIGSSDGTFTFDDEGHGTAVAGIIAANTNNGAGIAGIVWNSSPNLLSVKVLDETGSGSVETVALGMVYATDNQARIINLSLGSDQFSAILEGSIRYATNNGVLIVAAAGNAPISKPIYPAAFNGVMAVAASNYNDQITSFSSYGPYISVAAPGENIFTTYCYFLPDRDELLANSGGNQALFLGQTCVNPDPSRYIISCNNTDELSCYLGGNSSTYLYISGTSFAAPIVAGLAALIITVRPDISNEQVRGLIESTARDIGPKGRDNFAGYGRVDATAIANALKAGTVYPNNKSVLQGIVTGANFGDVIVNLDPPNLNKTVNGSGGYRYDNLGAGTYTLRLGIPKLGIILGPVTIKPNGKSGNVINVNFDVATFNIACGSGAFCPSQPQPVSVNLGRPLSPDARYFDRANPLPGSVFFGETGHNLNGAFRNYWERNGGLSLFGYPISEEFTEISQNDGRRYTVQYFERNRFEYHPENSEPNQVLLGLLGKEMTVGRIFPPGGSVANSSTVLSFPETGHTLSDRFLNYWRNNGGLAIFGYPISEPIQEGAYLVQYFERNRFEYHPENAGTRYEVLLGLLGKDLARLRSYIQ